MVVGDLDCGTSQYVKASGRAVDLKKYVEKGNEEMTEKEME